jgi:putative hydrolase of the HAD superfamily
MIVLALDAMGVIYSAADDVAELLCPFIHEHGGLADDARIEELYRQASLGDFSPAEFWQRVGLDASLEDEYLSGHALAPGLMEFLSAARPHMAALWCLSNDIGQWSCKLRERFGLTSFFDGWVISGDIGARKPDPAIYRQLLKQIGARPAEIMFVDDKPANLDGAAALGIQTVLFAPLAVGSSRHRVVKSLPELHELLPCGRCS